MARYSIFIFLCFFFFIPITQAKEYKLEWKAEASFESLSFLLHRQDYGVNEQETLSASFEFIYDNDHNFYTKLKPKIRFDILDHNRNRYIPDELFIKFYNNSLEFSAGLQLMTWGVSNSFNPTDVLNRKDLEDNFYRPEKMGDLIFGFKGVVPSAGHFSDLTFELLFLPLLQKTPLPESDNRFTVDGSTNGVSYTLNDYQETLEYPHALGGAFRFSGTYKAVDFSFHFYHGPEKQPGFYLLLDNNANFRLTPFYYMIDMLGLNVAASVGKFVFHVESAFKITRLNEPKYHELPLIVSSDVIPNDYVQFVPGVDYTINNVFGGDVILTLEYLGENDHSVILEEFRPFKNDLFLGVQYNLNNKLQTEFKVGLMKDLSNKELITMIEMSTLVVGDLKFGLESVIVNQDSNPDAPLSFFENNSYLLGRLSYSFGKSY